jgi:hypothetical protein
LLHVKAELDVGDTKFRVLTISFFIAERNPIAEGSKRRLYPHTHEATIV